MTIARRYWLIVAALLAISWIGADCRAADGKPVLRWEMLAPIPDTVGVAGPFAGITDDALIVAGGANFPDAPPWDGGEKRWHDRIYILPKPDGAWREADTWLPRPTAYGVSLTIAPSGAGSDDKGVLCIGGGDAERHFSNVSLIRLVDGDIHFTTMPSLPRPAAFMCGAQLGHTVYVAGGREQPDSPETLKTFWALDLSRAPDERRWEQREPWPGRGRMLAVAGVQGQSFYLFGGVDLVEGDDGSPRREYLADAYRFTPGEGWQRVADMPHPTAAAPTPALRLGQSHLGILGGDNGALAGKGASLKDAHPGFPRKLLAYNVTTDAWATMGELDLPPDAADRPSPDGSGAPSPPPAAPVTTVTVPWHDGWVIPSGEIKPGIRTPGVLMAHPLHRSAPFRALDYAVLALYLGTLVAMGFYFSYREKTTNDFFLGGQRVPWWAAGLSIFGTQLSAITFMAIPAKAFASDWVYLLGNVMVLVMTPVVVYLYLPFFRRLNVTTAYEYLERRFNLATRLLGSAAFILLQLGRMGVVLYLPAMALSAVTGFDVLACILLMGVLATAYTVLGGIEAVVWTDVIQVIVLLGGAVMTLGIVAWSIEGGLGRATSMAYAHGKFHTFTLSWDFTTTALWVVVIGKLMEALVPYTADQTVVQRYLTTRDERQAARSIWTNGLMVVPASTLFFAVGTGLWVFYRVHPELLAPLAETDRILPWFIAQQLPMGVSGLVLAALFAAAMSSLDSSMNSIATAVTTDWYRRFQPHASDHHCLNFARWLTVLLGAIGTGFAVYMALSGSRSMWDQYIKIVGLFGGGLAGLFAVGIFTRRATGTGALVGFFVSAIVLAVVKMNTPVHFFLFAAIGIVTCAAVAWLVSLLTPPRDDLHGLTIHTLNPKPDE